MGHVKRPKRVEYLASLLRTESGKLLKRQLRELHAALFDAA